MRTILKKIITNIPSFLYHFITAFCVTFIVFGIIFEIYKSQKYIEDTGYEYCSECKQYHAVTIYKKVEVIDCSKHGDQFIEEEVSEEEYEDFVNLWLMNILWVSLGISFLFSFIGTLQEADSD